MTIDICWAPVIVLGLLVVWLLNMWQQGVQSRMRLANLIVLILTDDNELEHQRRALGVYIDRAKFPNRGALLGRLTTGFTQIAGDITPSTMAAAIERLWIRSREGKAS